MKINSSTISRLLVENLVGLTSIRDRDALLRQLTAAALEITQAQKVEAHHLITEEGISSWVLLARATKNASIESMPEFSQGSLDLRPHNALDSKRTECLQRGTVTSVRNAEEAGWITEFPVLLTAGNISWGLIEIYSEDPLGKLQVRALEQLLRLYVNIMDLLDYSDTDALTGLWNRKIFDDLFYKTISVVESAGSSSTGFENRSSSPTSRFWLAMIDIDHFKSVNDRFGHLIGDEVLILVSRIMKKSFRNSDRVFRFGGEEFLVALRCTDHAAAVASLERFRRNMENYEFPQAGRITASIGFTEIRNVDAPSAACERADQAVYFAKQNGRNRVCSESELVQQGLLNAEVKQGEVELF